MKTFIVFACCMATLASARPDVSLGYHYHPEYNSGSDLLSAPLISSSYAPAASGASSSVSVGGFDNGAATSSGLNFLSPGYTVGGLSTGFSGSSSGYSGSSSGIGVGSFGLAGGDAGVSTIGLGSGFNGVSQGFVGASQSSGQVFQQQAQFAAPLITKNFYVHSAPEDHDDQQIVRYVTIGRPQKNYRVLFINAPSSTSTRAKIIANVAPVEDKTAVYVLSKKTNDLDITADVVTPAPTGPSKPDVFFIKYKTPEEAVHAQHVIQAQYDQLGGSTNFSNEGFVPVQSVIGSLGQGNAISGGGNSQSSSQLITQGSDNGGVVTSGLVPSQSQFDQIRGGNIQPLPNYLPPKTKYRRF